MLDAKLYLPEEWCNDPDRCKEAGIHSENRVFTTKLELTADIIHQQIQNGVCFDYVGGDGYYSTDANLAKAIDQMGYINMLDIHSDQKIFLNRLELFLPECMSTKGPAPKRFKATTLNMSVSEYMESLRPEDWEQIQVRKTTKGKLNGEYHFFRVYIWNNSKNQIESLLLIIRETMSAKNTVEIKYPFTNANQQQYTHQALVYARAGVLCRKLHQRIQANIGIRPVSDTQMAGLATSGGFEFSGVVVYPQRKTAMF